VTFCSQHLTVPAPPRSGVQRQCAVPVAGGCGRPYIRQVVPTPQLCPPPFTRRTAMTGLRRRPCSGGEAPPRPRPVDLSVLDDEYDSCTLLSRIIDRLMRANRPVRATCRLAPLIPDLLSTIPWAAPCLGQATSAAVRQSSPQRNHGDCLVDIYRPPTARTCLPTGGGGHSTTRAPLSVSSAFRRVLLCADEVQQSHGGIYGCDWKARRGRDWPEVYVRLLLAACAILAATYGLRSTAASTPPHERFLSFLTRAEFRSTL
jgi:hypothetical protein